MSQQSQRRLAMPVEIGGLAQQRDDPVDARELDDGVDGAIVQARGERAEREAHADLGAEAVAPLSLVAAQTRLAQIVGGSASSSVSAARRPLIRL